LRLVQGVNSFSGHVFGSRPLNANQSTAHIRLCFLLVNKKILTRKSTLLQAFAKAHAAPFPPLPQAFPHMFFGKRNLCVCTT
jgi:hypothetical protein